MNGYLQALALTIALETPVVASLFPGRRLRMAGVCMVATTASHLALHFAFPRFLPPGFALVTGEIFATLAEAAAYALASRDLSRSLIASGLANGGSYLLGLLL